jgi:hypothetical protein
VSDIHSFKTKLLAIAKDMDTKQKYKKWKK